MGVQKMDEGLGLPLQQALEQYADRDKWRAFCEAATRKRQRQLKCGSLRITVRHVSEWADYDGPSEIDEILAASERAERVVVGDLWAQLYRGELIATGIECPPRMDSERRHVPRNLFRILSPRFGESSLVGPDIKIVDVLIQRAKDCGTILENERANTSIGRSLEIASVGEADETKFKVSARGLPGRPKLPADIEREARRHAEAGELCNSLNQEALYLQGWSTRNGLRNSKDKPWAASTIRNNLRALYRELRAQKSDPK